MKNYIEIIRDLREDNDKTQKDIAEYLGTTQQVYSRYEKGENEIYHFDFINEKVDIQLYENGKK